MKKYLLIALLLLVPALSHAAITHHYTCADFSGPNGSETCTGSTITWSSTTKGALFDDGTHFNLNGTTNWLISFTASGSGTGNYQCSSGSCGTIYHWTTTVSDVAFTNNSGINPEGIYFENGASTGAGNFVGTMTNICITDTAGGCSSATVKTSFGILTFFGWW